MGDMDILLVLLLLAVVGAVAAFGAVEVTRRRDEHRAANTDEVPGEPEPRVDELVHQAVSSALAGL